MAFQTNPPLSVPYSKNIPKTWYVIIFILCIWTVLKKRAVIRIMLLLKMCHPLTLSITPFPSPGFALHPLLSPAAVEWMVTSAWVSSLTGEQTCTALSTSMLHSQQMWPRNQHLCKEVESLSSCCYCKVNGVRWECHFRLIIWFDWTCYSNMSCSFDRKAFKGW